MNILSMKEDYIEAYVDLYMEVFQGEPWYMEEERGDILAYFRKYFNLNNFLGYTIVDGAGELLGFSLGYKKPWIEGYEYYIDQFCIGRSQQGQGLGRYFLDQLYRILPGEEIANIVLMTEEGLPAYSFYRGQGFEELEDNRLLVKELGNI